MAEGNSKTIIAKKIWSDRFHTSVTKKGSKRGDGKKKDKKLGRG